MTTSYPAIPAQIRNGDQVTEYTKSARYRPFPGGSIPPPLESLHRGGPCRRPTSSEQSQIYFFLSDPISISICFNISCGPGALGTSAINSLA